MGDQPTSDSSTPPSNPLSTSDSASSSQIGLLQKPLEKANLAVRLRPQLRPAKSGASTSPTLDGLPEELLENVFLFLDSQTVFLRLCRVSRRFQRAATPFLYREFHHELYTAPNRLHVFLRNIIKRPILATYLTKIDLRGQQKSAFFNNMKMWALWAATSYKPELAIEDRELFKDAAEELRLEQADALATIASKEEAQAALLLSRATNVTDLSMNVPNLENSRLLLDILRETTHRGTALQNLRSFTSVYNFDGAKQGGFELAPISSLFRLPKIESIHAVACLEPEDNAFRGFDCPEGTSTVTEIEFRRSSVCPKAMSLMIGACRGLKHFYCDWGGHTVGWSEVNFPTVGAALRKQEHSLESLVLDVRKHYHTWPEEEDVLIPPLGSFAGFRCLTSISAPGAALVGWDEGRVDKYPELSEILPPSLRSLRINQWAPEFDQHLEKLSDVVVATLPNLREISLEGAPEAVSGEELQRTFDSKGARVKLHVTGGDEVDHFE